MSPAARRRLRDLVDASLVIAVVCLVGLVVAAWWLPPSP